MRFAVWAVIASVTLMPGTVRASVVHVHDHGLHEHQQPLFLSTPAGAGHAHHHDLPDAPHESHPGDSGGDVSVVESGIVDEAVTAQAAASTSLFIAMPVVFVAMIEPLDVLASSPPSRRTAVDPSPSCVCRIVQTSHALLL